MSGSDGGGRQLAVDEVELDDLVGYRAASSAGDAEEAGEGGGGVAGTDDTAQLLGGEEEKETPEKRRGRMWLIILGASGTVIEWYDFMLFSYLTPVMSKLFFPSDSPLVAEIEHFGVFAAGFIIRPIGGLVFGRLGDKIGRKNTLLASVLLMTFPMAIIAVLPTYEMLGWGAPVLLTLTRIFMGFSVGGEYTGSIITLLESSPNEKRGFMANTANVTGSVGVMLASLVVTILTASMSEEAMLSYGWRLCFAVGALLSLSSLALRRYMHESPSFERIKNAHGILKEPLVETFRNHKLAMVYSFFLSTYLGASYYFVASYIPTYLETVVNYPKDTTMVITTIISVVMAFLPFLGGWASDKYGRRPVLLVSTILSFILVTPVLVLQRTQDVMGILFGQLVWAFIQITFAGGALPAVAEMFPSNVRFTALGLSYNLAHSLLVGTTPMICTALVQTTGNPLTPAGWIGTLAVVCVPVAWFMRETAWIDLDRE